MSETTQEIKTNGASYLHQGANIIPSGGVRFCVWAPGRRKVEVVIEQPSENSKPESFSRELLPESEGFFRGEVAEAGPATLYYYRINDEALAADPYSRFQPQGPDGPSQVIDPNAFQWTDQNWKGLPAKGQVIYEMHVGTFTKQGSWSAAINELEHLAQMGITVIELMPIADFPGRFGWGYDGVNLFSPTWLYGTPDDFRKFVDVAHSLGMGVILDVVYNHVGPEGCCLRRFSDDYFSRQYSSEWGDSFNFDEPNSKYVREFILSNVEYWIGEFHLDGFRVDATQQIFDSSPEHILSAITKRARAAAYPRQLYLIGENEPQHVKHILPLELGGYGMDALVNDDFHHSAIVAITSRYDAYYSDYRGTAQEFVAAMKWHYLYQGQWYSWQKKPRGTPVLDMPPASFINYLQSHDQVANSGQGMRIHMTTSPSRFRAITAVLLLMPQTPMLFQGQEFAASSPFVYFADHKPEIAKLIKPGRAEFLSQFRALATPEMQAKLPDPAHIEVFNSCKLDHTERLRHHNEYQLHCDLLRMRREDEVFSKQRHGGLDGAVLGPEIFVIRYFGKIKGDDRLFIVNFGRDVFLDPAPEPLLAPPSAKLWSLAWSSEDPRYGGMSTPQWPNEGSWYIQGEVAVVLRPRPIE